MKNSIKKRGFVFLAVFSLIQGIHAEEAARNTAPLIAGLTSMDVITITATRNPLLAMDYPGMVSVIDREYIERAQASTPDDILKLVPNLEFIGGPRRTAEEPSIRGFSGPDVIVLFDGARQNFNSGHDGRFFIDPEMLKQVEVLRGPASSLYGSGGTGGVIEFRTLDAADLLEPGKTLGARTSFGYQTVNNEPKESITLFGKPNSDLDLIGNFTKRDSGSIELGNGTKETATDDDIISGLAKATYKNGFHTFQGSFQHFENEAEEPNNGAGTSQDVGGIVNKDISNDTYRFHYNFSDPSNKWFNPDLLLYYSESSADEQRLDNVSLLGPQGELLERKVDTIGMRLDNRNFIDFTPSTALTLTYGGEFYQDEQASFASSKPNRDGVPSAEADFYGLFIQGELNLKEPLGLPGKFLVIPSLRYDNFQSSSSIAADNEADKLSPRVGISYQPVNWLTLFGNYAQAFRAPTFDELYASGTHFIIPIGPFNIFNQFVPNPGLQPQETETFEAGLGFNFKNLFMDGDNFETKGTAFRINGDNFIDQVVIQREDFFIGCFPFIPGNCDGTATSFNVPSAKLWGAEVEVSYENRYFFLGAGYSRIDGKNEDTGQHLGVLTPDQFTLNTGFNIPALDTVVGWRSIFASKFDNANSIADQRDAYDIHDVYLSWKPLRDNLKGISVNFGVDNIFDEAYTRIDSVLFEAGRNFKVNLAYTLNW